ncbi:Formate dehydrogenase subunit alpha [Anaerolineae bacterium]|nr:Formate dehydrogenase subunit alpha [Anaerolineae bacterium]
MSFNLSRRQFLKSSLLATGGLVLPAVAGTASADGDIRKLPLHKQIGEARTICPYCSCGCGLLIATDEHGHITNVEGDPENPVNRGILCPKAIAVNQLSNSPLRLGKVRYRAPGASDWEEKSWDWAIEQIAQRIKATRDQSFVRTVPVGDKDVTVNRTEALAFIGGAANSSEECYLATKLARTLGIVYLEHQARL